MKVAINGLGRIGRNVLRIGLAKDIKIVAVNDLTDTRTLAYLLRYDSVYGLYNKEVEYGKDFIKIDGRKIKIFSEEDPTKLPWEKLGIDVVVEATGRFRERDDAGKHLIAGAKKVLITAVGKDSDKMIVYGVNHKDIKEKDRIISAASCTTNCLAPVAKILNDKFGIRKGFMTTIHAYTSSQNIIDGPKRKIRRGRAGAVNIVPTTSGATTAVVQVIPKLKGKLDGLAMRVPVPCGSIVDFVAELKRKVTAEKVNKVLKEAAEKEYKDILNYAEEELVSSDIIGDTSSAIIDALLTQAIENTVKVQLWYDNEFGYSNRVVDILEFLK